MWLNHPRGSLGSVIESASGLAIGNQSAVEAELDRLTIPRKTFTDGRIYGVEWEFVCDSPANTTARSSWVRFATLQGSALAQMAADASSGDVYAFRGRLVRCGTRLGGICISSQVFGSTFTFCSLALPSSFDEDIPIILSGSSALNDNVVLRSKRLIRLFNS